MPKYSLMPMIPGTRMKARYCSSTSRGAGIERYLVHLVVESRRIFHVDATRRGVVVGIRRTEVKERAQAVRFGERRTPLELPSPLGGARQLAYFPWIAGSKMQAGRTGREVNILDVDDAVRCDDVDRLVVSRINILIPRQYNRGPSRGPGIDHCPGLIRAWL